MAVACVDVGTSGNTHDSPPAIAGTAGRDIPDSAFPIRGHGCVDTRGSSRASAGSEAR
jgi:hypothetical protein